MKGAVICLERDRRNLVMDYYKFEPLQMAVSLLLSLRILKKEAAQKIRIAHLQERTSGPRISL